MDRPKLFKVVLAVTYRQPRPVLDAQSEPLAAVGFYRTFIVSTASEQETRALLARCIKEEEVDADIDWEDSEIEPADPNDWADVAPPSGLQILYKSGHVFFP